MRRYSSNYRPRSIKRFENKIKRNLFLTLVITLAITYLALTWGLPALVGSLSAFNKFKPAKPKEVIEDTAIAPPVLYIPFEATNSANLKIKGYASADSEVAVYFDDDLKDTANVGSDGGFETKEIPLDLGINNISAVTISKDNKKSLPSKTIKLIYSDEKPTLDLAEPQDGLNIQGGDKKVKVSGKTEPANSVLVNGTTAIVNSEGNFSTTTGLNDGDNILTVTVTNSVGNKVEIQRKVTYQP